MTPLDLNLLLVFEALFDLRNVTASAERLKVSQSTMSYSLAKLRRQLDDPLFVKSPGGMQPTPHAIRLADDVRAALDIVRTRVLRRSRFVPAESERGFVLCMTEVAEATFLPRLLQSLRAQAPGVRLRTVMLEHRALEAAMATGDVDLAIGWFPDLKGAAFYQQGLFPHPNPRAPRSSHVCLMRADHPRIGTRVSARQLFAESHVQVKPPGRSHEVVDQALREHGLQRRVVLLTPHFSSLPGVLAASDLVAIVPRGVGALFAQLDGLKALAFPVPVPNFDPKQYWHQRFHEDEENRWLRQAIGQLFAAA